MPQATRDVIYKRTSTGAVQEWEIELDGSKYRTISGQQGGAKTKSGWQYAKPKNVGRANETTAVDQALMEVEAKYKKKLAQGGYHVSVDNIDKPKFFKPMLAQNYDKVGVDWDTQDVFSQPKLDGIRCIATRDGLWTRMGKPIVAVPHVHEALMPLFDVNPDLIFDGEMYADKLANDFNKIISLVRKKNPTAQRLAEAAAVIQYHIYDFPSFSGNFRDRCCALVSHIGTSNKPVFPCIVPVATTRVLNADGLDLLYGEYMEAGYEGQMVRVSDADYEQKRSKQLLKRKQFIDEEYEIVAIEEGVGNRAGMAGRVVYKLKDGRTFGSGIKGTHEYSRGLLEHADAFAGGVGTCRFFELTIDGIPRFPVTVHVEKNERGH